MYQHTPMFKLTQKDDVLMELVSMIPMQNVLKAIEIQYNTDIVKTLKEDISHYGLELSSFLKEEDVSNAELKAVVVLKIPLLENKYIRKVMLQPYTGAELGLFPEQLILPIDVIDYLWYNVFDIGKELENKLIKRRQDQTIYPNNTCNVIFSNKDQDDLTLTLEQINQYQVKTNILVEQVLPALSTEICKQLGIKNGSVLVMPTIHTLDVGLFLDSIEAMYDTFRNIEFSTQDLYITSNGELYDRKGDTSDA